MAGEWSPLNHYHSGDTTATYNLSDISLKYDAVFDKGYATTIAELYAETIPTIPYTNNHDHNILRFLFYQFFFFFYNK